MALVSVAKVMICLLLSVSADGRLDSPGKSSIYQISDLCKHNTASKNTFHIITPFISTGHTAQYCTYTTMENESKDIITDCHRCTHTDFSTDGWVYLLQKLLDTCMSGYGDCNFSSLNYSCQNYKNGITQYCEQHLPHFSLFQTLRKVLKNFTSFVSLCS